MKKIFFIIVTLFVVNVFAQQEPLFTQYYVNDMFINPAVSGSKSYNPLTLQTRQQWLGFEGAPLSTNISYHGTLNHNGRSAMGGYFMFDKATPTLQANLHLNYAYHVPLNYNDVKLSFGLGAKLMYHNIEFNKNDIPPGTDPAFSTKSYDKTLADASSGVYVYGKEFNVGFSISNMFQSSFNNEVQGSPYSNSEYRNYYGMGAYKFNVINNDWELEPSFLIRKLQYQKGLIDITTRIIFLENNWAGLAFRNNGTAIFSLGFGANNMHISYSYDYSFSDEITQYTYGTHELGISFRMGALSSQRHTGFWGY